MFKKDEIKIISIFGVTGSVGVSTQELIQMNIKKFKVDTIVANNDVKVLIKAAKIKDESSYILCCHIEADHREKENKDLSLNKLIDKNLESYCMFVGVPYSDINPSVRDFQTIPGTTMKKKYQRQQIIDRIVEKHRRLVKQKPKEFKKWLRDNEAHYRGPF